MARTPCHRPERRMSLGLAIVGCGKDGAAHRTASRRNAGFDVRASLTRADNLMSLGSRANHCVGGRSHLEFTSPHGRARHLRRLASLWNPIPFAETTGWFETPAGDASDLRCRTASGLQPNFSIGINVFFQAVAMRRFLLRQVPKYEAWGWKIHPSTKKDAPSGTPRNLAEENPHFRL